MLPASQQPLGAGATGQQAGGSGCAGAAGAASAVGARVQRVLQVEWVLQVLWGQWEQWVQRVQWVLSGWWEQWMQRVLGLRVLTGEGAHGARLGVSPLCKRSPARHSSLLPQLCAASSIRAFIAGSGDSH